MKRFFPLLLAAPLLLTGCANWGATQSFDAGRAAVETLDSAAGFTCDDRKAGDLTPEQEFKCKKFQAALDQLLEAIDVTEASWSDLAPMLGVDPETFKVPKKTD